MNDELNTSQPLHEASEELLRKGFLPTGKNSWTGFLAGNIRVAVSLPCNFPYCLPRITVVRADLPRRVPHVEENGKICLPEGQGTLIDSSRPAEVVAEALVLATRILESGISGEADADFSSEFLAYWGYGADETAYSICSSNLPSRQVCLLHSKTPWRSSKELSLLADTDMTGKQWMLHAGVITLKAEPAWLFRLSNTFIPPDFGAPITSEQFLDVIRSTTNPFDYARFQDFMRLTRLPVTAVFSMPADKVSGDILTAVRFEKPCGIHKTASQKGFRPGRTPPWHEFRCISQQLITRLKEQDLMLVFCYQEEERT